MSEHFIRPDNDPEPTEAEIIALADSYADGLAKMKASGYEEYGYERQRSHAIVIAALRAFAAPTTSPEPDAVREALNEVVTNGEWTSGDQSGEWKIPREVYLTATDALSRPAHGGWEDISTAPMDGKPFLARYQWLGEHRFMVIYRLMIDAALEATAPIPHERQDASK